LLSFTDSVSWVMPPIITVSPLFTSTVVRAERFVVVGPTVVLSVVSLIAEDSW